MYEVRVTGMTCSSCASSISRVLKRADPEVQVSVDVDKETIFVKSWIGQTLIAELVEEAGFPVVGIKSINSERKFL